MTMFNSSEDFKWLPISFIVIFLVILLSYLSYWYITQRQRNKKLVIKKISPSKSLTPKKSLSINSSQLTETDINYLDKLVRSASDRTLWKKDDKSLKKIEKFNIVRKVPSQQIEDKILH